MSREPSDPVDTQKVEESQNTSPTPRSKAKPHRKRGGKIDWDAVKVFQEPEYKIPYKLTTYMPGKRSKNAIAPELWVQVAIESGLVAMASQSEATQGGEWLEPLNGNPPARMNPGELQTLIADGIADILDNKGNQGKK